MRPGCLRSGCRTDNGIANAIVMPHVIRLNSDAAQPGLEKLASALGRRVSGTEAASAVIEAIEDLVAALRTPRRLRDVGVTRESLAQLAAISMEDWFVRDNPRRVHNADELLQVLNDAW